MHALVRASVWIAMAMSLVIAVSASAERDEHKQAIEQAVLNRVSAIYDMTPELIDESVSPKLQKLGYMPAKDGSGLAEDSITCDQLKELASNINKVGMFDPATSPREVSILRHTDMIANVKLGAAWGIDYIHLSRSSGKWMIMNVIREMPSE